MGKRELQRSNSRGWRVLNALTKKLLFRICSVSLLQRISVILITKYSILVVSPEVYPHHIHQPHEFNLITTEKEKEKKDRPNSILPKRQGKKKEEKKEKKLTGTLTPTKCKRIDEIGKFSPTEQRRRLFAQREKKNNHHSSAAGNAGGTRGPLLRANALFMAPRALTSTSSSGAASRYAFASVMICKQCFLDLDTGSISTASTILSRGKILMARYSCKTSQTAFDYPRGGGGGVPLCSCRRQC